MAAHPPLLLSSPSTVVQVSTKPAKAKKGKEDGEKEKVAPTVVPSAEEMAELLKMPEIPGDEISTELQLFELCRQMSIKRGDLTSRMQLWSLVQGVGDLSKLKWSMSDFEAWYVDWVTSRDTQQE